MSRPLCDLSCLTNTELLFSYLDTKPSQARMTARNIAEHVAVHRVVTNRGAKVRVVFAPDDVLTWFQNRIRHGLLAQLPVDSAVHGFVRGRGIVTNARAHAGRREWVLNVDIRDFFPSISSARVDEFFRTWFAFNERVAWYLTQLTTFSGHLAQGFTTSPELANFVSWHLDRRMSGIAAANGLVYTRYADDLTMSCPAGSDVPVRAVIRKMASVIRDEGFAVNWKKVSVMKLGRRQVVTGFVLGDRGTIRVDRRMRRLLRAAVHHWPQQTPERRNQIRGLIAHVHAVDPVCALELLSTINKFSSPVDTPADKWHKPVPQEDFTEDIASVFPFRFVNSSSRRRRGGAKKGSK